MAPNTNELPRLLLGISLGLLLCACRREAPSVNRSTGGEDTSSCTFSPPIADGADPWIVRRDDWYYLVESKNEGISVYRSKVLTDPKRNEVQVWSAPEEGWNQTHIWAPELHFVNGRWYIYYAAGRAGPPSPAQRRPSVGGKRPAGRVPLAGPALHGR